MKFPFILLLVISPFYSIAQDGTWFEETTEFRGLSGVRGFKSYVADLNGDLYPDLITITGIDYFNNESGLRLWINEYDTVLGNPKQRIFKDRTAGSGLWSNRNEESGRRTTALAIADVDNDGDNDIVTAVYFHRKETTVDNGDRAAVLLNNGNATFTYKENSGLDSLGRLNTQGVTFLDVNRDGNIDLFLGNWSEDHTNNVFQDDALLLGNGDGSFSSISHSSGIAAAAAEPLYGSSAGDWNNDGWTDIFTAPYCRTRGRLWKNNGDNTFTDATLDANYNAQFIPGDNGQPLCMWGAYPSDFDNDGDFDYFFSLVHGGLGANEGRSVIVVNGGPDQDYRLEWQRDLLPISPPSPGHHADYEACWFDADQDGLVDLLIGQGEYPNNVGRFYLYHQQPDHTFKDITLDIGFAFSPFRPVNRVRVIDFDLDGDEDMLVSAGGSNLLHLLENRIADRSNHVSILIEGPDGTNRSAIGTNIKVYTPSGMQMKEIYAGQGNAAGQNGFCQHFGIGNESKVDSIVISLPNKEQSHLVIEDPEINSLMHLTRDQFIQYTGKTEAFSVFPNPVSTPNLSVFVPESFQSRPIRFSFYSLTGKLVHSTSRLVQNNQSVIALTPSFPSSGVYLLRITPANGEPRVLKIVYNPISN
jgi:hypothetical protein